MIVRELLTKIGFLFDKEGLSKAESGFKNLVFVAGGLTAAVAGVSAVLIHAARAASEAGSAAIDGANRLGITAEQYQKLGFAASQSGASVGALEGALKFLQRTSFEASKGGKKQSEVFAQLGISAKEAAKASSPELLGKIADKISAIKDPAKQTALATKLLGRSFGTALLPLLKEGSAGIDALTSRAEALGFVLSNEDAAAAEAFGDATDQLNLAIKGVTLRIGAKLIPIFRKVVDATIDWFIANRQLIDRGIDVLVYVVDKAVDGLMTMARVIQENKAFFIAFLGVAVAPLIAALFKLALAWGVAALPAIIAAAAYLAVSAAIAYVLQDIYKFVTGAESSLGNFLAVFGTKIEPNDHWLVKVLKEIANTIILINKEYKDAGGLFQAMHNVKEGLKEDLGLNPPQSKYDPNASTAPYKTKGEELFDWLGISGGRVPRGTFNAAAAVAPMQRAPTSEELINMGMGPVTVGDIKVYTTVSPGSSPAQTAELVKHGVTAGIKEAARQHGGSRGVR